MLGSVKIAIKFRIMRIKWKQKNKMNFTKPIQLCDIQKIDIGKYTYGAINAASSGCPESHLTIGCFCSIAPNVRFILDGEHNYHNISTYPFKAKLLNGEAEALCKGPIIVGDDVWIGERSMVLSGVTIGRGAVIGAGSTVRKSVPPYAVYVNDKVVKFRFSSEVIDELMKIDFNKLTPELIRAHIDKLYTDVSTLDLPGLQHLLEHIPR